MNKAVPARCTSASPHRQHRSLAQPASAHARTCAGAFLASVTAGRRGSSARCGLWRTTTLAAWSEWRRTYTAPAGRRQGQGWLRGRAAWPRRVRHKRGGYGAAPPEADCQQQQQRRWQRRRRAAAHAGQRRQPQQQRTRVGVARGRGLRHVPRHKRARAGRRRPNAARQRRQARQVRRVCHRGARRRCAPPRAARRGGLAARRRRRGALRRRGRGALGGGGLGGGRRARLPLLAPRLARGLQGCGRVQQGLRVHASKQVHEGLHQHRGLPFERALRVDGAGRGQQGSKHVVSGRQRRARGAGQAAGDPEPRRRHAGAAFAATGRRQPPSLRALHPNPGRPPTWLACCASSSSRSSTLSENRRSSRPPLMRAAASCAAAAPAAPAPGAAPAGDSGTATRFLRGAPGGRGVSGPGRGARPRAAPSRLPAAAAHAKQVLKRQRSSSTAALT